MPDASLTPGQNGLPTLSLTAPDGACAEVYLHGGHVTSWIPAGGREQLFLSEKSVFDGKASLRGGVPVCWPQFSGQGNLPKHGFARNMPWQVLESTIQGRNALARLELRENEETLQLWPYPFQLLLSISVGGPRLSLTLEVCNTGEKRFSFTGALHTYLRVNDITETTLDGLGGLDYDEYAGGGVPRPFTQAQEAIRFSGDEVDRVYPAPHGFMTLKEPGRALRIKSAGFSNCVVWNPGPELAARLADMEPGGQQRMVCVEAALASHPLLLMPGQDWRGEQWFTVQA